MTSKRDSCARPISQEIRNLIYPCIRELLINSIKHSGKESAEVELSYSKEGIQITVRDAGKGFDPEDVSSSSAERSFGLFSIEERLAYFGGQMQLDSEPGKGTKVTLPLPIR